MGSGGAGAALYGTIIRVAGNIVTGAHAALAEAADVLSQTDGSGPDTFYGALLVAEGFGATRRRMKLLAGAAGR